MTSEQPTPQPKKRQRERAFRPKRGTVNFGLPKEFDALCASEDTSAGELLRQFIADLCDLRAWNASSTFNSSGEVAHRAALAWLAIARQNKREKRAGADVATPQPTAESRATTPIEALTAAVERDPQKGQP